jgi:hypothetical protein
MNTMEMKGQVLEVGADIILMVGLSMVVALGDMKALEEC